MKDNLQSIFTFLVIIIILSTVCYGGWKLNRWCDYKLGYQSLVLKELQPLSDKIFELEKRVADLEKKTP